VPSTPVSRAGWVPGTSEWNGVFSVGAACRSCSPLSRQSPRGCQGAARIRPHVPWLLPGPVTVSRALSLARSGRCWPGSRPVIASVAAWPLLPRRQPTPAARVRAVGLAGTWPQVVKVKRYEASRWRVGRVVYVRSCRRRSGSALLGWLTFSGIPGIIIPGGRPVNDGDLPWCGFQWAEPDVGPARRAGNVMCDLRHTVIGANACEHGDSRAPGQRGNQSRHQRPRWQPRTQRAVLAESHLSSKADHRGDEQ
jgi:hypothetical protein